MKTKNIYINKNKGKKMERGKYYNPQIIDDLRCGDIYKIATRIKDTFKRAEIASTISITNDYRNLMVLLTYLAKSDTDLRSTIELRKNLLGSYDKSINDWQIEAIDNTLKENDIKYINEQFEEIVPIVSKLPCDLQSFGQILLQVEIENGKVINQMPIDVFAEIVPQTEFQRDIKDDCKVWDKNNILQHIDIIGRNYIDATTRCAFVYIQNDELFAGGSLKSLALNSALHINNAIEWATYNQKLQGIISASYDLENLQKDIMLLQQYETSLSSKSRQGKSHREQISAILDSILKNLQDIGKNQVATHPQAIDIKYNNVVSNAGYNSYEMFDKMCKVLYEVEYLGQSSNTLTNTAGSYAGAGLRQIYTNTQNKERQDRIIATSIINKILSYYWAVWKGTDSPCLLRFKYGTENNEDVQMNMGLFSAISSLSMNKPFLITEKDLYQKLGMPLPPNVDGNELISIGGNQNTDFRNMPALNDMD